MISRAKTLVYFVLVLFLVNILLTTLVCAAGTTKPEYIDINGHWAKKQIMYFIDRGILKGTELRNNKFSINPNNYITRAEFISLVVKNDELKVKSDNIKQFKDVKPTEWYKDVIDIAVSNGIIGGYKDNTFNPNNGITRAEMATLIAKSSDFKISDTKNVKINFKDVTSKDWFYNSVVICKNFGILNGYSNGNFIPKKKATRAEAIVALYNANSAKIKYNKPVPTGVAEVKSDVSVGQVPTKAPVRAVVVEKKPDLKLKPEIQFGSPFNKGSDYLETKESAIMIQGTIFSNFTKDILYSVLNDPGDGNRTTTLKDMHPQIVSVVKDVYTAKVEWRSNSIKLEDGLNTFTLSVVDVYGNQKEGSVRVLRFVDNDSDGISNFDERGLGTDINKADTDYDGLSDFVELKQIFTDYFNKDTDGDGLSDYDEVEKLGWRTSPTLYGTMGNGISDANLDIDGDGKSNYDELYKYKTDPIVADFNKEENESKAAKSIIELPTNSTGIYRIPVDQDIYAHPIKIGNKRKTIVIRIQFLLNRIIEPGENTLKFTGEFDSNTKQALKKLFGEDEVDLVTFKKITKIVTRMLPPDDTDESYLSYSLNEDFAGVKQIKSLLEAWRISNAPNFQALHTIASLYENDGTFSGIFDQNTVALLKLFQMHNGLKPTGKINSATAHLLLSCTQNWKIDKSLIKNDILIQESFGQDVFYRYVSDAMLPPNPVYYSQNYGSWSRQPYYDINRNIAQNGRVIARNGCGPTATAMVIASIKDKSVDPADMAKFSMENDHIYYYETKGTLYPAVANKYGLNYDFTKDMKYVINYLNDGKHVAIASMSSGHFTNGGHLLALMGTIQIPGEDFIRIIVFDSDTGNQNYGKDGTVILSRVPGIIYAKPESLQKEQALGFWLIWEK